MKHSIVETEIMGMGLDKEWADKVRAVVHEIRAYPQFLVYHLNEEQRATALALGAMYWREYVGDLTGALRNDASAAEFAERCGWYSQGNKDCEYHHGIMLGIYSELHHKLQFETSTFFSYRADPRYSTKRIVFEKISDLEVLEYAVRNAPIRRASRGNLFQRNPQSHYQQYHLGAQDATNGDEWILPDKFRIVSLSPHGNFN